MDKDLDGQGASDPLPPTWPSRAIRTAVSTEFNATKALNHEMFMQKVTKNSLSSCDEKRKYINKIESIPWGIWKFFINSFH